VKESATKILLVAASLLAALLLIWYVQRRPGFFSNTYYLGGILLLELILVSLWRYETRFLPFMMVVFLWAGMDLPYATSAGLAARWFVLGFGALAGFTMWINHRREQRLTAFHLTALFCVVAALVSAMVSDFPDIALLKVLSLFMLFLYCASGARCAIHGREEQFVRGLVASCEVLVYASTAAYFILRLEPFGNRNSLGAIIGVAAFPVLAWAALVNETPGVRRRLTLSLFLCGFLLYSSSSRASIAAAIVSGTVLCLVTARPRALYRGAFFIVLFLTLIGAVDPSGFEEFSNQTSAMLYKRREGSNTVLASREGPWHDTMASIKKHPWFGSGFGTSDIGDPESISISHTYSLEGSNREHGNSYLAMAEYMGLLGIVPFVVLLILTVRNVWKVCAWVRRTGDLRPYAVPFSVVIIGALVHAAFEDWLFAVGYYLCVFFWICAFMVTDFVSTATVPKPASVWPTERSRVPVTG
jgi:O-antigen ligase